MKGVCAWCVCTTAVLTTLSHPPLRAPPSLWGAEEAWEERYVLYPHASVCDPGSSLLAVLCQHDAKHGVGACAHAVRARALTHTHTHTRVHTLLRQQL